MTEHPGDADPTAEPALAAEEGSAAESVERPETSSEPVTDDTAAPADAVEAEEPDALGHVVEQTLVPDEQSTVAQPGEALDELLPALATTGHDGVDDALATLDEMAEKSVHDHVEVFDAVHEELRRTLDQAADQ